MVRLIWVFGLSSDLLVKVLDFDFLNSVLKVIIDFGIWMITRQWDGFG